MPNFLAEPQSGVLTLDTWPVMEWLKDRESAAQRFEDLLQVTRAGRVVLQMSTISLGEVFYSCWREWDEQVAHRMLNDVRALPISFLHPTVEDVLQAASLKGRFAISYADAFTAVLALRSRSAVLTGDPDFLLLARAGILRVEWWGA